MTNIFHEKYFSFSLFFINYRKLPSESDVDIQTENNFIKTIECSSMQKQLCTEKQLGLRT